MAWGRRCDLGCESWPDDVLYKRCPECGEPTTRYSNLRPMPRDEARSILLHKEFDKFYEKRCAKLGIAADGPLPDPSDGSEQLDAEVS